MKYQDYLKERKEKLKGGKADGKTLEDIAKAHSVSLEALRKEFELGVGEEMEEHTSDRKTAEEIVLDHLVKDCKYYTKMREFEDEDE